MSESAAELEAQRQTNLLRVVWASTVWLPLPLASRLAGVEEMQVEEWLADRKLFSVQVDGQRYLPRYGFDAQWHPIEAIAQVLEVFKDTYSNVALAAWFAMASDFLDGAKPLDLLEKDVPMVIACANDCFSNEHYAG